MAEQQQLPEHYREQVQYPAEQLLDLQYFLFTNIAHFSKLAAVEQRRKGRGFLNFMMVHEQPLFDARFMFIEKCSAQDTDEKLRTLVEKYNPEKAFIVRLGLQANAGTGQFLVRAFAVPRCDGLTTNDIDSTIAGSESA